MTMKSVDPFSALSARSSSPSARVFDALRAEIEKDPAPRKSLSSGVRVALSAGALFLGLVLTSTGAVAHAPGLVVLVGAAVCLGVAGLLLAGAIPGSGRRLSRSGLSRPARLLLAALIALFGFVALSFQAESFLTWGQFVATAAIDGATRCAGHSLASGALGAGALLLIWRKTDPFSPGLTGALLGLFGGAMGTVAVGLACHHGEGLHLTLGHGIGLVVLSVLGWLVGRRWLSP